MTQSWHRQVLDAGNSNVNDRNVFSVLRSQSFLTLTSLTTISPWVCERVYALKGGAGE